MLLPLSAQLKLRRGKMKLACKNDLVVQRGTFWLWGCFWNCTWIIGPSLWAGWSGRALAVLPDSAAFATPSLNPQLLQWKNIINILDTSWTNHLLNHLASWILDIFWFDVFWGLVSAGNCQWTVYRVFLLMRLLFIWYVTMALVAMMELLERTVKR